MALNEVPAAQKKNANSQFENCHIFQSTDAFRLI